MWPNGVILTRAMKCSVSSGLVELLTLVKHNWAAQCDFQQCGIMTCVESEEPVQPPVMLRSSKCCSASSLTQATSKVSDQTAHMRRLAWAFAGHKPHYWKFHVAAQFFRIFSEILSECRPNPCFNGLCSETATGFICRCMSGFTGDLCDTGNSKLAQNMDHWWCFASGSIVTHDYTEQNF